MATQTRQPVSAHSPRGLPGPRGEAPARPEERQLIQQEHRELEECGIFTLWGDEVHKMSAAQRPRGKPLVLRARCGKPLGSPWAAGLRGLRDHPPRASGKPPGALQKPPGSLRKAGGPPGAFRSVAGAAKVERPRHKSYLVARISLQWHPEGIFIKACWSGLPLEVHYRRSSTTTNEQSLGPGIHKHFD